MKLKKIFLVAVCLHLSSLTSHLSPLTSPLSALSAKPRTEAQMAEAAAKTINGQWSMVHGQWSMKKVSRGGQLVKMAELGHLSVMGYENGGFAVVTNDDLLPAVVGYSDKSYGDGQLAEGFDWWLMAMQEAAAYYVQNNMQAQVSKPDLAKCQPEVHPLLSTEWGQEEPFNNACPLLLDDERYPRHCVVGCVATAAAQILNYHQYPTTGHGITTLQVPYGDPTGTKYSFDFSACHFDWAHMRNTYTVGNYTDAEAKAVADLSHAMGMMAVMQYGIGFSGAISDDAANGLRDYFGVSTAQLYSRSDLFGFGENYTDQQWSDMVFKELSDVGPVYYAGNDADDQGGHAFVLDGYNADGLVHVNWGWHGRFDGFYDISLLNPRIYRFSKGQEMILGICPPQKAKGMTEMFVVDEPGTLGQMIQMTQDVLGLGVVISSMTIGGTLNDADLYALAAMDGLTSIDISSASLVGDQLPPLAFYGCTNLRSLRLPETMRYYGDGALAGCSNLNLLTLPEGDDKDYCVKDGVVYSRDMTEVIAVLPTAPDEISIAEGVTVLHDHAFEGCKYVRIVNLPASLTTLGERSLANVLIMRELHLKSPVPATANATTFDGVDPGFLKLFIPAGSRDSYAAAKGWSTLFKSDNVTEVGTMIRARDITRNYGEDVEEYYYEIIGERVKGLPELACAATKDSPAGTYLIVVKKGTIESDNVTLVDGTLTVLEAPAPQSLSSAAQSSTFNFGYCGGEVSSKSQYGGIGIGNTSAAIFIPAATLAGMDGCEIQAIRVGLATRLNIDELTVWIRSSLNGDNLAEETLNRKQTRVRQGWNEVALSTPFTISGQETGLYVGYTYHHISVARAVSVVGSTPAATAFYQEYDDAEWQDLSAEGAISIEAVVSGSALAQYDLALNAASLTPNLAEGSTSYKLTAQVTNMGTQDVEGFDLTVTGGGIGDVTTSVRQSVASGRQQTVQLTFKADAPISDLGSLVAAITRIDGGTDEKPENNSVSATFALERNVLLEEFTTEQCSNCPAGAETMHQALNSNAVFDGRISVVCHHSAFGTDWLTQPCDQDYLWMFNEDGQTYAPAWMIDRKPYFMSNIASGNQQAIYFPKSSKEFAQMLTGALQEDAHVALGAKAVVDDGRITVTVNGLRDDVFSMPNARLTVYLTEDNIKARSQQGASGEYIHQHVIRCYNSSWGDVITWDGNTFTATQVFAADASWKELDLKVVAFVANYDSSSNLNCMVENVVTVPVTQPGTDGIRVIDHSPSATEHYYDLSGRRVVHPAKGIYLKNGKKYIKKN